MTDIDDRDRRHRLHNRQDQDSSSQQIIRLDEPRPGTSRSKNEYVDVTKLPTRARQHRKHQNLPSSSSARHSFQNALSNLRPNLSSSSSSNEEQHSRNTRVLRLADSNNCSRNVSAISSNKSISVDRSIACQRPAITTPGRVVRVVATSETRQGHASNTYSVINRQPRPVVCSKIGCSTGKKEKALSSSTSLLDPSSASIMCKRCGRCRCSACARRKQLPSRWICGNHCLLSSKSIVDAVSCMCCVKACLYHVGGHVYDDCESDDFYDEGVVCDCDDLGADICGSHSLWSCSTKSTDRCFRWTILGSALACLPCLWMYWPLKTCASGIETAYSKYYERGCRCERENGNNRYRRSRTMPPELPSVTAAKIKHSTRKNYDEKKERKSRRCSLNVDET